MFGHLDDVYSLFDLRTAAVLIPAVFVLLHVIPYLLDPHGIRLYPGPFLARFSDFWLGWVSKQGHRSEVVHDMHVKYGQSALPNPPRAQSLTRTRF